MTYHIAALYKFGPLDDAEALSAYFLKEMKTHQICGTLIFASEGINGTIAGSLENINYLVRALCEKTPLSRQDIKWSRAREKPFKKTKTKFKTEIVTLRQGDLDCAQETGIFVDPENWNYILEDPDTIVIDTRNFYETELGSFEGALDPGTENFTDFPDYVDSRLDPDKHKKVAMFCTGGIRCEKASAYMRQKGFENVYQLKGGILKYLETMSADKSKWHGECFVFDDRVALGHGLHQGEARMCWGCGLPLTRQDQTRPEYEDGVSCARCYHLHDEQRKQVLRERHERIAALKKQGEASSSNPGTSKKDIYEHNQEQEQDHV